MKFKFIYIYLLLQFFVLKNKILIFNFVNLIFENHNLSIIKYIFQPQRINIKDLRHEDFECRRLGFLNKTKIIPDRQSQKFIYTKVSCTISFNEY